MSKLLFDTNAIAHKINIAHKHTVRNQLKVAINEYVIDQISTYNKCFDNIFVHGLYPLELAKISGDVEYCRDFITPLELSRKYDLVISFMYLHMTEDIDLSIMHYKQLLAKNGMLMIVFFGGDTFLELKEALIKTDIELLGGALVRTMPKVDVKDAARIMQKHQFINPMSTSYEFYIRYNLIQELLYDIKAMALGNVMVNRSRVSLPKAYLSRLHKVMLNGNKSYDVIYQLISAFGVA